MTASHQPADDSAIKPNDDSPGGDLGRLLEGEPKPILERRGYRDAWGVVVALRRTHHRVEVAMDQALDGYGVSFAQYLALQVVAERPAYLSFIARRLRITRQATDRLLFKLAAAGLIARIPAGHVTDVEITDVGRARLAKMDALVRKLITAPMESSLDARELFALDELLAVVDEAVRPNASPTWWLD